MKAMPLFLIQTYLSKNFIKIYRDLEFPREKNKLQIMTSWEFRNFLCTKQTLGNKRITLISEPTIPTVILSVYIWLNPFFRVDNKKILMTNY